MSAYSASPPVRQSTTEPSSKKPTSPGVATREREDAALALVVGAHDEDEVLDDDDQRQRPEEQRNDAEHRARIGCDLEVLVRQTLAHRVQGRRADVAVDDAERAEREHRELLVA